MIPTYLPPTVPVGLSRENARHTKKETEVFKGVNKEERFAERFLQLTGTD